jgi:hypothetical protein
MFMKEDRGTMIALIWLRMGTGGGLFGFYKIPGTS